MTDSTTNNNETLIVKVDDKIKVEINKDAIEPKDYFKVLKKRAKNQKEKQLEGQLETIAKSLVNAKKVGQTNLLHRLTFTYDTIVKEQQLLANGIKTFVYAQDVKNMIDKVTPKNSIKVIELERYPRVIPIPEMEKIKKAKDLNIFDDFVVVFTDFTDSNYASKEEQATVARNRDPIVFGYFHDEGTGFRHDRFYLIADWKDDYCELDFAEMLEKMRKVGIKKPQYDIATDDNYVQEIIENCRVEMEAQSKKSDRYGESFVTLAKDSEGFWKRLWKKLTK